MQCVIGKKEAKIKKNKIYQKKEAQELLSMISKIIIWPVFNIRTDRNCCYYPNLFISIFAAIMDNHKKQSIIILNNYDK